MSPSIIPNTRGAIGYSISRSTNPFEAKDNHNAHIIEPGTARVNGDYCAGDTGNVSGFGCQESLHAAFVKFLNFLTFCAALDEVV